MSKRSYRRLAVVAGAALAVGSMAPAMAQRVEADADGAADVSVNTIDVSSILGGLQSTQSPTGLVLNTVGSIKNTALSTAFQTTSAAQTIAYDALGSATCVAGAGTSAVLGLGAGALADAGVGIGLGGVHVGLGLDALVGGPVLLVSDVTECLDDLKYDAFAAVAHVKGGAGSVAQIATGTALSAVGTVQSLPGTVLSTATPLLLNDLLTATGSAAAVVSLF